MCNCVSGDFFIIFILYNHILTIKKCKYQDLLLICFYVISILAYIRECAKVVCSLANVACSIENKLDFYRVL